MLADSTDARGLRRSSWQTVEGSQRGRWLEQKREHVLVEELKGTVGELTGTLTGVFDFGTIAELAGELWEV